MLKYIYEKFFQRFVIEDIAECFDSFEKQHKDILTNHCRCTKREYTYSTTMEHINQFIQPQHYSCGDCGKPIIEQSNYDVHGGLNSKGGI